MGGKECVKHYQSVIPQELRLVYNMTLDLAFRSVSSPCVYRQFINVVKRTRNGDGSLTVGSDAGIEPSSIPVSASVK